MSCKLNALTSYNVGRVIKNNETGVVTAQLVNAPASCPDQAFSSKKAEIKVVSGANPELYFSQAKQKAIVVVPRAEYVEQIGSSGPGFGTFLIVSALLIAVVGIFFALRRRQIDDGTLSGINGDPAPTPRYPSGGYPGTRRVSPISSSRIQQSVPQPVQAPAPTIINNSSNDGLLTGVLLGNMMSNNNHSHTERVVERETIIERQAPSREETPSFSSDDDSRSNSFSSDSDSGSSFSSDSDSGSSFSSDSGSSFSSDSGGGSFSSDS